MNSFVLLPSGDSSGATDIINRWVADKTAQKITGLIPPGVLNALTRLVLVNAVYFKGDWDKKFDVANTKEEDFFVSSTEKVRVQLMFMRKAKFNYGVNPELATQAIELPYAGGRLSMFVLLPDPTTSLQKLESALTVDHVSHVLDKFRMSERDVHVWLPRFRLEERLALTEILAAMGLTDMFSMNLADFSGIDGTKELFVSKVLHQAVIDVNEEGSEAAAATAVVMMLRCAPSLKDPFEFRADRPFIFFIRDNSTNSILFLGRLVKPEHAI
jgi:serine protease inhibitor